MLIEKYPTALIEKVPISFMWSNVAGLTNLVVPEKPRTQVAKGLDSILEDVRRYRRFGFIERLTRDALII